jgi:uncharacterized protein YbaR (Trm112 family)
MTVTKKIYDSWGSIIQINDGIPCLLESNAIIATHYVGKHNAE